MILNKYTKISPVGDSAIRIEFGKEININTYYHIQLFMQIFKESKSDFHKEIIPSFASVTIEYDAMTIMKRIKKENTNSSKNPFEWVRQQIELLLLQDIEDVNFEKKIIEIPVCYGEAFGPDLQYVASYHNMTVEEVIKKHSEEEYLVYMLGFAPGFPFLGGLNSEIATPRKLTPRLKIEAGSVGIAGNQTGVYPIETPGGWQIIGRTPVDLFRPNNESPTLLKAGVWIRFKPITPREFNSIKGGN